MLELKQEGASDDKSDEPPILPSNLPLSGKLLAYQQILESKKQQEEEKKKKREKEKKRRKEKEKIIEILWKTTSYCKEQDWKFAI
jgi:hypothetical protein